MLGAAIAQALLEGLIWLAGAGFERWSRKSPARRLFFMTVVLVFTALIFFGGVVVGALMVVKGPSMVDRVVGAFMAPTCLGVIIWAWPKVVQRFRSPPVRD